MVDIIDRLASTSIGIENIIYISLIVIFASFVQSATGFGFAIVALPIILLIIPIDVALGINLFLATVLSILLRFKTRKNNIWDINRELLVSALFGVSVGLVVILYFPLEYIKFGVGIVTIMTSITVLLVINEVDNKHSNRSEKIKGYPDSFPSLWIYVSGLSSGFMTSTLTMPGPPVIVLVSLLKGGKEINRATITNYFRIVYPVTLISMIILGVVRLDTLIISLAFMPALLVGLIAGDHAHAMIGEKPILWCALSCVFLSGVLVIAR